jgi:hypothetical protein
MDETQKALDELKALISKPLVRASLKPGETLLYVVATTQVISAWPVYYNSKVLTSCETRYNQVQKLLYAILIMMHKLLY